MSKIMLGITDHYAPDVQAMMMAKYSRSFESIKDRMPDTKESEDQHRASLYKYYIGYGHKSVSQLGSTTIWLEGISQLAAKAVENHPLFNGQESSSRYQDFTNQEMYSSDPEITQWQEKFRTFYVKAVPLVIEKIKKEFPFESNSGNYHRKEDAEEQSARDRLIWENTIKARTFDICRGLLPAGCTTNVAFTGTFDTINDHFGEMLYHPCQEMKDIAVSVLTQLKEKYPYAAMDINILKERNSFVTDDFFYQDCKNAKKIESNVFFSYHSEFEYQESLANRTKFSKINRYISNKSMVSLYGYLDFGSYRDIHRHRNGSIAMEVLGTEHGFHDFYFENLPIPLQDELNILMLDYERWYENAIHLSKYDKQYSTPMGFTVFVDYECDLNQALYIFELRSGKTVHQTLRMLVQDWVNDFKEEFESELGEILIHADMDKDNFTLRRGMQVFSEPV